MAVDIREVEFKSEIYQFIINILAVCTTRQILSADAGIYIVSGLALKINH